MAGKRNDINVKLGFYNKTINLIVYNVLINKSSTLKDPSIIDPN